MRSIELPFPMALLNARLRHDIKDKSHIRGSIGSALRRHPARPRVSCRAPRYAPTPAPHARIPTPATPPSHDEKATTASAPGAFDGVECATMRRPDGRLARA
ncbi:hypothetical protein GCM10018779_24290 [Streptomyces griseocarneus]|nr:hypothetical protein GCM10018779_24290 [Streptomyces griseocarneus]